MLDEMKTASETIDVKSFLGLVIFPITSLSGLANLLRSEQTITKRAVVSVILNSGLFGVSVAAGMLHKFGDDSILLVITISILSGLGGNAAIDFALQLVRSAIQKRIDKQ